MVALTGGSCPNIFPGFSFCRWVPADQFGCDRHLIRKSYWFLFGRIIPIQTMKTFLLLAGFSLRFWRNRWLNCRRLKGTNFNGNRYSDIDRSCSCFACSRIPLLMGMINRVRMRDRLFEFVLARGEAIRAALKRMIRGINKLTFFGFIDGKILPVDNEGVRVSPDEISQVFISHSKINNLY